MRLNTIAVALLVASTTYAEVVGQPSFECNDCIRAFQEPAQRCAKNRFSIGLDFANEIGSLPADERKCVCTEVASNKWVNACRAICPVRETNDMYARFELAKSQCVGVSTQSGGSSSATLSLASGAGAALAIAAAAAQAFF